MIHYDTIRAWVDAYPPAPRWMRWPVIRHARWLLHAWEQDMRLREYERAGRHVPEHEYFENERIEAIWRGAK